MLCPQLFAMLSKVTRALGYRYLWIDSLCILQDAYDDWDNDSSRMQEYYMNAILTLALDGRKATTMVFLTGTGCRMRMFSLFHSAVFLVLMGAKCFLPPAQIMNLCICLTREAPALAKRGWTLQEDILAASAIHYENRRLHWDCQKHR
jgi:hypothetical protein